MNGIVLLVRPWYWLPPVAAAIAGLCLVKRGSLGIGPAISVLIAAGPGLAAYAESLNDLCEREVDKSATRKKVWGIPLSGGSGALIEGGVSITAARYIVAATAITGCGAASLRGWRMGGVYLLGLFVATAYSARPFRLKRRGWWGVIIQIIGYGPIAFHLGVTAAYENPSMTSLGMAMLIGAWVGAVGMTADLLDLDDDERLRINTVAVLLGRMPSTTVILCAGTLLLCVVGVLTWRWCWTPPHIGTLVMLSVMYVVYARAVWSARYSGALSPLVHGLAVIMETVFPLALVGMVCTA